MQEYCKNALEFMLEETETAYLCAYFIYKINIFHNTIHLMTSYLLEVIIPLRFTILCKRI